MAKRNLYLHTVSVEEAKEKYLNEIEKIAEDSMEEIDPKDALGRITWEPVHALCNSPLVDSSAMDGVAVIAKNTEGADEDNPKILYFSKDYIVVDTGDPILPPYDSVIMVEDIVAVDENAIEIRGAAAPWQHVRPVGEDIVQGEMILPGNHEIRPIDISVLIAGGMTSVKVHGKRTIAVIPTGTEIIRSGEKPKLGDIIDSNSSMLSEMSKLRGFTPVVFEPIPDEYETLKDEISKAVEENDMVAVIAGSSAGTEDYTVHILRELGEVIVHGVAMKPGKPVILAIVKGKPVIGVPGYPVSAYLAFDLFASPVMERLTKKKLPDTEDTQAIITRRIVSSLKHREYVRVKMGRVNGRLIATPLARGAGAAMSLVRADGFCIIDQNSEGVEGGSTVDIKLLRSLSELYNTLIAIGSHDLLLDIADDLMQRMNLGISLSSTHVGSMGGLLALSRDECHLAPTHILDENTGIYNEAIIKDVFGEEPMALIKGMGRTQGIMVKKGNPLGIQSLKDLVNCRFVNRQRGAGTRLLLDYKLKEMGVNPKDIQGYTRESATHMAVAAAVKSDSADAGLGIHAAAHAMDLDFIPVAEEEYDFAVKRSSLELPEIKKFIAVLQSAELREKLDELGGYTFEHCGQIVEV